MGVALPGQEVAILGVDREEVLGKGCVGEVADRGNDIAIGYANAESFVPDRWLRTGDCGHLDDDGYLFLFSSPGD